jgi:uncharacterized membrane protein
MRHPDSHTETAPAPDGRTGVDASAAKTALCINRLRADDPLQWLSEGWHDFLRAPFLSLFFGACFVVMGHVLLLVAEKAPAYVMTLSAGWLLLGPLLCLGVYDISRQLQKGRKPALGHALFAWLPSAGKVASFAAILLAVQWLWSRVSLALFAINFDGLPSTERALAALRTPDNLSFIIAYCAVGAVFAFLVFITSVIAIPMILDKRVDAVSACLTSMRACIANPITMAVWAALIALLIAMAMLPFLLGLLIIGPVLGHGTWHAYRALVYGDTAPPVRLSV